MSRVDALTGEVLSTPEARITFSTDPGPGSIFAKLAAILAEVERLEKSGTNDHFGYHFVTESDLTDFIRPKMAQHGLAVFPSLNDIEEAENQRVILRGTITVGDESGAWITGHVIGEARDADSRGQRQDKGVNKAITAMVKYFILKLFLISTGDDPEHDRGNEPGTRASGSGGGNGNQSQDDPICPKCGGPMWDNCATRSGRQPHFKCKDKKECDHAIWADSWATDLSQEVEQLHQQGKISDKEKAGADAVLGGTDLRRYFGISSWLDEARERTEDEKPADGSEDDRTQSGDDLPLDED